MRCVRAFVFLGGLSLLASPAAGMTAETADDPVAMRTTMMVIKVDADTSLAIRTSFQAAPPTLTIEFPSQQVMSSLPERSSIGSGVIQSIIASYDSAPPQQGKRFLSSLQIALGAPYTYHVRSEPGRVVVEILHPASVSGAAMEVGLGGGTIIGGFGGGNVTERFRAMQKALAVATPTPWTPQFNEARNGSVADLTGGSRAAAPMASPSTTPSRSTPALEAPTGRYQAASPLPAPRQRSVAGQTGIRWWIALLLGVLCLSALSLRRWGGRLEGIWMPRRRPTLQASSVRVSAGVVLVDQLVWRAFERQGYQLVTETELTQPLLGTLRVIMKDGAKAALLFVGQGPLFEKQTVERFLRAMRKADATQGFLVAAGSFTVPAQRIAKEHQVVLIEREQLTELLSTGAGSESFTKQLEQSRVRFEEAQETLRQYANELDTLRRQRNEASWSLGEERAKSAKLEAQFTELGRQFSRYDATIARWEQDALALRKRWEESQWYLGEGQSRIRYLESQLGELQQQLEVSADHRRALQRTLDRLKQELQALRTYGERRRRVRAMIPETAVELVHGEDGSVLEASPRDISSGGVGLAFDRPITANASMRVRLRLPGREPIASKAKLMWQRSEGEPARYQSGCRLIGLSASTRALIEQLVEEAQSSRA